MSNLFSTCLFIRNWKKREIMAALLKKCWVKSKKKIWQIVSIFFSYRVRKLRSVTSNDFTCIHVSKHWPMKTIGNVTNKHPAEEYGRSNIFGRLLYNAEQSLRWLGTNLDAREKGRPCWILCLIITLWSPGSYRWRRRVLRGWSCRTSGCPSRPSSADHTWAIN